jgi:hypothetical protein
VANSLVESKSVCKIAAWFIAVAERSVEVEVTKEQLVIFVCYVMVLEPINKKRSGRVITRSIDCGQFPEVRVLHRGELNRDAKIPDVGRVKMFSLCFL